MSESKVRSEESEVAKHTAGPWYCTDGHEGEADRWGIYRVEPPHYCIAVVENGAPGDTLKTEEATAHLIAAAPEILEALDCVAAVLKGQLNEFRAATKKENIQLALETVQTVIAKAKGGAA